MRLYKYTVFRRNFWCLKFFFETSEPGQKSNFIADETVGLSKRSAAGRFVETPAGF